MDKRGLLFVVLLLVPSVTAFDISIKDNNLIINGEFNEIKVYHEYEENGYKADLVKVIDFDGDNIYDLNTLLLPLDESYYFLVCSVNERDGCRVINFGYREEGVIIGKGLHQECSSNEECASGNCVGPGVGNSIKLDYHCCPIDKECFYNNECYDVGEPLNKEYICSNLNEFKNCRSNNYCEQIGDAECHSNNKWEEKCENCVNGGCVAAKIAVAEEIEITSTEGMLFPCPAYGPGIQIKWTSINGADHYRIEYKKENGEWKKFMDRPSTYNWVNFIQEPNIQDCNIKGQYCSKCIDIGKAYYFRVKAQDKNNNDLTEWSNAVLGAYDEEGDPCAGEGTPCKYGLKGYCTSLFGIKIFVPVWLCEGGCVNRKCSKTLQKPVDNKLMEECVINCDIDKCNQISDMNRKETALEQYTLSCNNDLCGKENCARKLVFMYVPEKRTNKVFTDKFLNTYMCDKGENLQIIKGKTQEECRNVCESYEGVPGDSCCEYLKAYDVKGKEILSLSQCIISNALFLEKNTLYGNSKYSAILANNINKDIFLGDFEIKKYCSGTTIVQEGLNNTDECRRLCQVTSGATCCDYDAKYNNCYVRDGYLKNSNYEYQSAVTKGAGNE